MPFSQFHADIACNFFERVLKHTQDEWYGRPFLLAPWQEEAVSTIFGTLDEHGNRLIETVYLEVPKKTGKTEWAAGMCLLIETLDEKPGCQVYGAAAAQRQSLNVYRAACKMVEQSPELQKIFRILRGTNRIIKRTDPESFYAAIAADGDISDGINPAAMVADEVHRWKTRKQLENHDVLSLGSIARRQALGINITTAGVRNESPLAWRLHEKTLRIASGVVKDPTFYGRIYAAGPKDDWTKEETWRKANPSLRENGGFLDIEKIRKKYIASLSDPESIRSFKRYYLNLWDEKQNRAIDMAKWDLCSGNWKAKGLLPRASGEKVRNLPSDLLKRFIERKCWAGVDLSLATDFTAVCFVFPAENGCFEFLPFYWLPAEDIVKRERKDGMPYRTWAEQGFLELCDGPVIDYRDVEARLRWGGEMFSLEAIGFDPANSRQISAPMTDEGFPCIEVRQGFLALNEGTKKFLDLVTCKKLRHGDHPIFRFNAHSLGVREKNDLMMPAKPERHKDSARIDGIAAAIDALSLAIVTPQEQEMEIDIW